MKLACFGLLLSSLATAVRGQTLDAIISNNTELSSLFLGLQTAGLLEATSSAELTLFAPNNNAFAALDPNVVAALLTPEYLFHLQTLLFQHAVDGTILSSNVTDGLTVESLAGPLSFSVTSDGVFVSSGAVNNSQVVEADILADNGVIHIIDEVLLPTVLVQTTWRNLLDVEEGFEVIKELLQSTGLFVALDGPEPVTILAPPDAVFAGVSQEALDSLNLTEVLLNHALPGLFPTNFLTDGSQVTTALGLNYTVAVGTDGAISIGGIPLVEINYVSLNGIAHVLGGLLLPPVEGQPPVAPPVLAPTEAPTEVGMPTIAPDEGGAAETPSSAATVGTFMTMAAMLATALFW